ncbi:MAG: hypothetical protein QW813_03835, partial [Candidatus Aenigmatarchaeota archaeon]
PNFSSALRNCIDLSTNYICILFKIMMCKCDKQNLLQLKIRQVFHQETTSRLLKNWKRQLERRFI